MKTLARVSFILAVLASVCQAFHVSYINGTKHVNFRGRNFKLSIERLGETQPQIYQQTMDHNDPSNTQTWNQRYWVNSDYYQQGGPVFFMFGGEGPADGLIDGGSITLYAQNNNALLVCLEHRFYGDSQPGDDLSLLSSMQALADANQFIGWYQQQNAQTAGVPWVAFGGSYPGNLAAWFRLKYPQVVVAAVASSAPVEAQFDFQGYGAVCSQAINQVDSSCYNSIMAATSCMEGLIHGTGCQGYQSTADIPNALQQCYNMDWSDHASLEGFFGTLSYSPWYSNYPGTGAGQNCPGMDQAQGQGPLEIYGAYLQQAGIQLCGQQQGKRAVHIQSKPATNEEITKILSTKESLYAGLNAWFYQTCNEFGYFQTSDTTYKLMGTEILTDESVNGCQAQFGQTYTADYIQSQIANTNQNYGGKQIQTTCVVFVSGSWDPWSPLSITQTSDTSSQNSVVFIPQSEHCGDMQAQGQLNQYQQQILNDLNSYLNNPACQ